MRISSSCKAGWSWCLGRVRFTMKCNFLVRVLACSPDILAITNRRPSAESGSFAAATIGRTAVSYCPAGSGVCVLRVVVSNDVSEVEHRPSSSELLVDRSYYLSLVGSTVLCRSGTWPFISAVTNCCDWLLPTRLRQRSRKRFVFGE